MGLSFTLDQKVLFKHCDPAANELFLWVKKLIGVLYKGLFCNDERIRMLA